MRSAGIAWPPLTAAEREAYQALGHLAREWRDRATQDDDADTQRSPTQPTTHTQQEGGS